MRLGLVLGEAASGLRRNISMVISVVLVTFISLTFVGTAILLQQQIGQMKGYWYDRAQVTVSLCTATDSTGTCAQEEATDAQKGQVEAQLESTTLAPYIERYEFEDREQAFKNFQQSFKGSPIVDLASPEFLPESFRVKLKDPTQAAVLIESLSGIAGVQSVKDERAYLDPILNMLNVASYAAIGLAALMLIAAALLIATTIRLSAFSRRREIGIMRLVGASNRFIQTPFILEGVFASLIGSLLAGGAVVAIVHFFVRGYLVNSVGNSTGLVGVDDALIVVPILVAIGGVLAAGSAGVAISRYLKV
ncbi:ABC transporter permease [Glaciihabitans arcticus]|uniref:Cell division protein FtsX n=1 Tax=Glaciihabitans arcticus TaxID=2668039 RepID=A0A4Q9GNJ1_9MICO|nr:permease-like cell division protein FtsX [Glaciihabitans arcticus]TBN56235.1 ABC transporter permease [Glaciihabitans arcticus]